jgi:hypothetical protein
MYHPRSEIFKLGGVYPYIPISLYPHYPISPYILHKGGVDAPAKSHSPKGIRRAKIDCSTLVARPLDPKHNTKNLAED